jgi:ribosomal protein S18 acetylase RimI-like enzyme
MTIVRPARRGDEPGILCAHLRAIRETASRWYTADQIAAWSVNLGPEIYVAAIEGGRLFVAEEAGEVLGFGELNPETGEVIAIYVRPDAQERGIGRRLLAEAVGRARRAGVAEIRLVSSINAAEFYRRHGFVSEGSSFHTLRNGVLLECEKMRMSLSGRDVP